MAKPEMNVGDEVWVHARVIDVGEPPEGYPTTYVVKVGFTSSDIDEWFRPDTELRTADDFKNPYDQGIVGAAIEWYKARKLSLDPMRHSQGEGEASLLLESAVAAKLDSEKPKSAEQVLAEHALWIHVKEGKQPTKCECGHEFQIGESLVAHQTKALRDAGLLNEPQCPTAG